MRGFPAPLVNYSATGAAAGRAAPPSARVRAGWVKPGGLAVLLKSKPLRDAEQLILAPGRGWAVEDFAALAGPDRPDSATAIGISGRYGPGMAEWAAGLDLAGLRRLTLPHTNDLASLLAGLAASPAAG